MKKRIVSVVIVVVFLSIFCVLANNPKPAYNGPELSTKTLFSLRSNQPWCYEKNQYTLLADGTSKYIILYDVDENQISIGGYELRGGDDFLGLYSKLYRILDDEFEK